MGSNYEIIPQIDSVEEAVIGALLIDSSSYINIADILTPESFHNHNYAELYKAISELHNGHMKADLITITQKLTKEGKIESIGGAKFIVDIARKVGTSVNIEEYAKIVAEAFIKRELIRVSNETIKDCFNPETDVFETMSTAENRITKLSNGIINETVTPQTLFKEIFDTLYTPARIKESIGVPGLNGDNGNINLKWRGGNLVIVAGRPGMGKTAFLCEAVRTKLNEGKRVLVFSLEMTAIELFNRMLAAQADVDIESIEESKLSNEEKVRVIKAGAIVENWKLHIEDKVSDINKIKAICRKYKSKYPDLGYVFEDYLQITTGSDRDNKNANRDQLIGYYTRSFKQIAKELNVPFVALAQVGRSTEKTATKKPTLSDLRESGNIEQDADIVVFLYRPAYYGIFTDESGENISNQIEFEVAKYRGGQVGFGIAHAEMGKNKIQEKHIGLIPANGYTPIKSFTKKGINDFDDFTNEKNESPF